MKAGVIVGCGLLAAFHVSANPTGGTVAAGSATIAPISATTLHITQTSPTAIIDWQTFSIARGEATTFVQPNAAAAVLNRVLGGDTSEIDGTLSANGQVYLINGNGILVSKTGKVNTAGFIASTQDISDSDFLAGHLHFTGQSTASVQNLGTIDAGSGNIYLIAQQVSNGGTLRAPKGTVGLAAGTDVLVAQQNADGSTVTVNPSNSATAVNGTGVANAGTIAAAAAELRAANGNIYALAINNTGTVRATGVSNKNGHIWLVADKGTVQTSGTLATGAAGTIVTNGGTVGASGTVNSGKGGQWTIDPSDVVISNSQNSGTVLNAVTLGKDLSAGSNETITAAGGGTDSGNIDVESPVTWTSAALLTLEGPGDIHLDANVTASKGTFILEPGSDSNVLAPANVNVGGFILDGGVWSQIVGPGLAKLPTFSAPNEFVLENSAVFARFAGGDGGGNPYQVVDIYGLEGLGTGNSTIIPAENNYILKAPINAAAVNWSFKPIAEIAGIFDGNKEPITGLRISEGGSTEAALFGEVEGTVENVNLVNVNIRGEEGSAGLASDNEGLIQNCSVTGGVTAANVSSANDDVGGLVGSNNGTIINCSSNVVVTVPVATTSFSSTEDGGMIGYNSGTVISCTSSGKLVLTGDNPLGAPDEAEYFGGLTGFNGGSITSCTNKTTVTVNVSGTSDVGGVAGENDGTISSCTNAGAITFPDAQNVGGIAGLSEGSSAVTNCLNTGAITARGPDFSSAIGGVIGWDESTQAVSLCYNTGALTLAATADPDGQVGGIVGLEASATITSSFNSGALIINGEGHDAGGIVGSIEGSASVFSCQNTGVIKITDPGTGWSEVGGIAGEQSGAGGIATCFSNGAITENNGGEAVGGIIGYSNGGTISYCTSAGSLTLGKYAGEVGGIVGGQFSSGIAIYGCSSSVSITITADSSASSVEAVGGLAGASDGYLDYSTSTGAITIKDVSTSTSWPVKLVGGIVGYNEENVYSCTHIGAISVAGPNVADVGGVTGENSAGVDFSSNSGAISVTGDFAQDIGGVVGLNNSTGAGTSIQSVANSGALTAGPDADAIGGVVGEDVAGDILFAANTGAVKAGAESGPVGGVIGSLDPLNQPTAHDLSNSGAVTVGAESGNIGGVLGDAGAPVQAAYNTGTVNAAGGLDVGGVVGNLTSGARLVLAYNTGSVIVGGTNANDVGGLIGNNAAVNPSAVSDTYSTGKVSAKGTNIGGLIGFSATAGSVSGSYWNVQSSGQASSFFGIPVNTTAQMDQQSTYVDWDFTADWGINPNSTPYLLDFTLPRPPAQ